jgi:hypothetical protein
MPAITTIKLRRGTAAQWTSANPVLAAGEMGIETDTRRSKIGDGTSTWSALGYTVGDSSGIGTVEWTSVLNKPTTFPPSAHTHVKTDITDFAHTHLLADITDYVDPTIYIDGGAANTVYAAYANINGGNAGSF